MKQRLRFILLAGSIFLLGALFTTFTSAQQDDVCPAIVEAALEAIDNICIEAGRNQACYGNVQIEAEPQADVSEFAFSQVGDIVDVATIHTMRLSPLDEQQGVWGLALMRLQANIPDTLPGQNVTFLLFGDVEITNAVDPDNPELNPMQAFFLKTGIGDAACEEAPESGLLVQTPEGVREVAFNVNGVDVAMGSTVYFQANPGDRMRVTTLEGSAILHEEGRIVAVPAGARLETPIDKDFNIIDIPDPEPYSPEEFAPLPIDELERDIEIAPPIPEEELRFIDSMADNGIVPCDMPGMPPCEEVLDVLCDEGECDFKPLICESGDEECAAPFERVCDENGFCEVRPVDVCDENGNCEPPLSEELCDEAGNCPIFIPPMRCDEAGDCEPVEPDMPNLCDSAGNCATFTPTEVCDAAGYCVPIACDATGNCEPDCGDEFCEFVWPVTACDAQGQCQTFIDRPSSSDDEPLPPDCPDGDCAPMPPPDGSHGGQVCDATGRCLPVYCDASGNCEPEGGCSTPDCDMVFPVTFCDYAGNCQTFDSPPDANEPPPPPNCDASGNCEPNEPPPPPNCDASGNCEPNEPPPPNCDASGNCEPNEPPPPNCDASGNCEPNEPPPPNCDASGNCEPNEPPPTEECDQEHGC